MRSRSAHVPILYIVFLAVLLLCMPSARSQSLGATPPPTTLAPTSTLLAGIEYYEQKRYTQATDAFKSVIDRKTGDSPENIQRADFFMAKSLYQMKLYAVSLAYFDRIASAGTAHLYYGVTIKWLLALSRVLPEGSGVHGKLATYDHAIFDASFNADVLDELLYQRGLHEHRKGDNDTAIAFLENVSVASPMRRKADFVRGVAYVARSEAELAVQAFKDVLKMGLDNSSDKSAKESARVATLATLQLARLYYANKDYETSIMFYEKIPKDSAKHQEAQFEVSWAYYLGGHFTKALASLYALGASDANAQVMPESSLLRSVIFYKLCQYDRGLENLAAHEKRYGDLTEKLAVFIDSYEDYAEFAMHVDLVRRKGRLNRVKVETFVTGVLLEGRSKKAVEWIQELRSEITILEDADPDWQVSDIADEALQELTVDLALAEAGLGGLARKELQEALADLKETAASVARTKLEIQTANSGATPAKGSATPRKGDEPFVIDSAHLMWRINRGFGKGPAGGYQFQVGSRCSIAGN